MSITKKMLSMLAFAAISLSACSDDTTSATSDIPYGLTLKASPMTISGKLQSKQYPNISDSSEWNLVPWQLGAGTLIAAIEGTQSIAEASVSADGSFSLTLPGSLTYPNVIWYSNTDKSIIISRDKYVAAKAALQVFYFYPLDNPATLDTNESQFCKAWVTPCTINKNTMSIETMYNYLMSDSLSIKGKPSMSETYYNCNYKKGWNIQSFKLSNTNMEIITVDSLPADVVWF